MFGMFSYSSSFNQDISNWNVSNVTREDLQQKLTSMLQEKLIILAQLIVKKTQTLVNQVKHLTIGKTEIKLICQEGQSTDVDGSGVEWTSLYQKEK